MTGRSTFETYFDLPPREASRLNLPDTYRVYIAGPMTGLPEHNYPAFNDLEDWLLNDGLGFFERLGVCNPARNFGGDTTREFREYMREDLGMLATCDGIVLLPGWADSRGAKLEVSVGQALGLDFWHAERGPDDARGWIVLEADLPPAAEQPGVVRSFESGATRDTDAGKLDYEGFYSPLVVERFAEYMNANRVQSDGSLRSSDNWQKGIPLDAYMKSLWRHFMDAWKLHRGLKARSDMEEALCAVIFNAQGYLFEILRGRG